MDFGRLENVIQDVRTKLDENDEWINRFAKYAKKIEHNLGKIAEFKKAFHEWKPLYLYMNVGSAKDSPYIFSLRYQGQDVATLNVHTKSNTPLLTTTNHAKNNKESFNVDIVLDKSEWRSPEAKAFRKFFSQRSMEIESKFHEHALESIFLSALEKRTSKDKDILFCGIRPVKFVDIARFQMCTPLKASNPRHITYVGPKKGGGIDVLARVGGGGSTRLCVMELKDNYESPQRAMEQAVAYATFLQELLMSNSGDDWLKIFGFSGNGNKLHEEIKVCIVMPMGDNPPCQSMKLPTERGFLEIHYIYLNADWRKCTAINGEKKSLTVEKSTLLTNYTRRGA